MSYFELKAETVKEMIENMTKFADGREAEKIINDYLWGDAGDLIETEIHTLLPESGRIWQGKAAAAKRAKPFLKDTGMNLNVRIRTKNKYHYLYFPDDGSNTIRHVGNQQFMFDGANRKADEIGSTIVDRLVKKIEEM